MRRRTCTSRSGSDGAGGGGAPAGTEETGVLFRSLDAGESWARLDLGGVPPSRMAKIAIDRARPALVCCCAMRGQVYISQDGGQAWQQAQLPEELSRGRHVYPMVCG